MCNSLRKDYKTRAVKMNSFSTKCSLLQPYIFQFDIMQTRFVDALTTEIEDEIFAL